MRITLNIDSEIFLKASELTGIREKTALVRKGLESLISKAGVARLAKLGGTEKDIKPVHRRRST